MTKLPRVILAVLCLFVVAIAPANAQKQFAYLSPRPGAQLVSPETTIAVRPGDLLDAQAAVQADFRVTGSASGLHSGRVVLADDGQTLIFKPDQPFASSETVSVSVDAGLQTVAGTRLGGTAFSFTTASQASPEQARRVQEAVQRQAFGPLPVTQSASAPAARLPSAVTLPADFPAITVTTPAQGTGDGYLFLGNFPFSGLKGSPSYLLILDNSGQPVYYKAMPDEGIVADFKKQPNGWLTYLDVTTGIYHALDASYKEVRTYKAGHNYLTDLHDLQLLPNNHALLLALDFHTVDMSTIVAGGWTTATVIGLVVQELDTADNVVFEWRSWDHFQITDTTEDLTQPMIDYVHPNAVELDSDGNILISSRHLDEITKVNRQTGAVMWRWGGKKNQFTFLNDDPRFFHQHDIRRLPNGNVTLFDNHNGSTPPYSRAVEYRLDEVNKTATRVWQYRNTPDTYSFAMGDVQRLPNGNSLIGWGSSSAPALTEVKPDGSKALEIRFETPRVSYRAFRFPWQGRPTTPPTLAARTEGGGLRLFTSWNGATEIASYRIYGGYTPLPADLLTTQVKAGFETEILLTGDQAGYCYYRVMPVDKQGQATRLSNVVKMDTAQCQTRSLRYFPFMR